MTSFPEPPPHSDSDHPSPFLPSNSLTDHPEMVTQPSVPEELTPSTNEPAVQGDPQPGRTPSDGMLTQQAHGLSLDAVLDELHGRRRELLAEIGGLEQQRDRLLGEIRANPIGQSELIAQRVKGFQAYLVGALQELAVAAEQAELVVAPLMVQPSPLDQVAVSTPPPPPVSGLFSQDDALIRDALLRYGGQPDFYADPWKLRRTLEPTGASLLEDWFLNQGGRGAQPSGGSRNRNVLVAAAAIAILGELYGDRFQTLVLAEIGRAHV